MRQSAKGLFFIGLFCLSILLSDGGNAQTRPLFPYIGRLSPSPDGRYIVFEADLTGNLEHTELFIVDVFTKQVKPLAVPNIQGVSPAWSPDGSVIAFNKEDEDGVFLVNPDGTNLRKLTAEKMWNPIWAPDGSHIAVTTIREGDFPSEGDILIIDKDGNDVAWVLTSSEEKLPAAWSPDGSCLFFVRCENGKNWALWRANIDMSKPFPTDSSGIFPLIQDMSFPLGELDISPDGTKIVLSGEDGYGIWIMNSDGSEKNLIFHNDELCIGDVVWCPSIDKIAFTAMEIQDYNDAEGLNGPYNIYLINPDGTGLEQITFFTGFLAKGQNPNVFAKRKDKAPVLAKANLPNPSLKKETKSKEVKFSPVEKKLAKNLPVPHQETPVEDKPKSQAPLLAGGLSLSALGYAIWKFLRMLS